MPEGQQFTLFHGTSSENAEKIMSRGLKPKRPVMGYTENYGMDRDDDSYDPDMPMYDENYPRGVYLTSDIEHAREFGDAVIGVDPSKLSKKNWVASHDDMAEVYAKRIPTRAMKRVE